MSDTPRTDADRWSRLGINDLILHRVGMEWRASWYDRKAKIVKWTSIHESKNKAIDAAIDIIDAEDLAFMQKIEPQRDRLAETLVEVCEMAKWQWDEDADENNTSPDDMTAHINGLIVKKICAALAELDKEKS